MYKDLSLITSLCSLFSPLLLVMCFPFFLSRPLLHFFFPVFCLWYLYPISLSHILITCPYYILLSLYSYLYTLIFIPMSLYYLCHYIPSIKSSASSLSLYMLSYSSHTYISMYMYIVSLHSIFLTLLPPYIVATM